MNNTDNNDGWISVEDKLPKAKSKNFNVKILMYTKNGHIKTGEYGYFLSGWGTSMTEPSFIINSYHYKNGHITHWQPLPPPPKDENA